MSLLFVMYIFMHPPPLGGAEELFLSRPSVCPFVYAYICDVSATSMVCIDGFSPNLSVVHLRTKMN